MNFLKKNFSPIILAISLFLLIYTFYRSEIHWNFIRDENRRDFYSYYYILSSILIIFSIFSFFISKKIKEYLIIIIISFMISLYLSEGYLTYKKNNSLDKEFTLKKKIYKKKTGKKWDTRSRIEIYKDLKKNNSEIKVKVHPTAYFGKNLPIYPLASISNSETIHCNENGYYSIYQSDRYGFNNPDTEWDKKYVEYLLVGDSFTNGACVNQPNDIASVLRTLSMKSVLNLGMGGNGPLTNYATLREYLNPNVKKVFWLHFEGNDIENLKNELYKKILLNYLNDLNFSQNLKFKQEEINNIHIDLIDLEEKKLKSSFFNNSLNFIKIYNLRMSLKRKDYKKLQPQTEFNEILELTKKLTNENNSKLYFVYLPEFDRYKPNYDPTNYNLIKNMVNELNIPFIDVHMEVFEKQDNPFKLFPFEQEGHYNIEGYKKISESIYKYSQK